MASLFMFPNKMIMEAPSKGYFSELLALICPWDHRILEKMSDNAYKCYKKVEQVIKRS